MVHHALLLQFREGLSDRQAAEAVRARIDWKYLLALDLADAGFDHTVLCESSAARCWTGMPVSGYSPACWTPRETLDCSRRAVGSARTARTCSPPCAT